MESCRASVENVYPCDDATDMKRHVQARSIVLDRMIATRSMECKQRKADAEKHLMSQLLAFGVDRPHPVTTSETIQGRPHYLIDTQKQRAYSQFIRESGTKLADFVRLLRGETESDTRPNKALQVPCRPEWQQYQHREHWERTLVWFRNGSMSCHSKQSRRQIMLQRVKR